MDVIVEDRSLTGHITRGAAPVTPTVSESPCTVTISRYCSVCGSIDPTEVRPGFCVSSPCAIVCASVRDSYTDEISVTSLSEVRRRRLLLTCLDAVSSSLILPESASLLSPSRGNISNFESQYRKKIYRIALYYFTYFYVPLTMIFCFKRVLYLVSN